MSRKKKGRTQEEMALTPSFMVFGQQRGYAWGPARGELVGTLPYWMTGKEAAWSANSVLRRAYAKDSAASRAERAFQLRFRILCALHCKGSRDVSAENELALVESEQDAARVEAP